MIRVLIVDDHFVVREGLKQFLAETPDVCIAGEAATGAEALQLVRTGEWDLVLLDIAMPEQSGLDVLKQIKLEKPGLPVLIFSMFAEDEYAITTLKAGAAGYLTKESAPEQLLEAIGKVVKGGRYVSPTLTDKLVLQLAPQPKPHERLTHRETQIMMLIARGRPLTQIAAQLNLSIKTVSTYRTRVLEKMALANNAELTRYVIEHKLERQGDVRL